MAEIKHAFTKCKRMQINYDEGTEEEVIEDEVQDEVVEVEETEEQEDTTDWKSEAEKERARADKAEHAIIKAKEKKGTSTNIVGINLADSVAILNAKVHEDDIERVERYAKLEGVSIREALKDPELKAILSYRDENRNTAVATNTSNSRRGSTKVTGDVLVANASRGKLPESDDEINRLIAAKRKES